MTELGSLWLPILVSTAIVFVASAVFHMLAPWHKNDFPALPDQDRLQEAMRPFAPPPGQYMLPRARDMKEMRTPEFDQKLSKGPVVLLTVFPNGRTSMGKRLVSWFVYCLVVGIFAAYVTGRALAQGTPYLQVFRFIGATAFLGYTLALWQDCIWFGRSVANTVKSTVDGLIYALLTAGTFGWLWPH